MTGRMHVLGPQGDVVIPWDPENPDEVEMAKAEWKRLKADGYEFFEVAESKGKRVTRFSKKLGKVIAAPGVKKPAERKTGKRPRAMAGGPNERRVA